jgi:hypothetical protein
MAELANRARLGSPLKHPRGVYESRCSSGHDQRLSRDIEDEQLKLLIVRRRGLIQIEGVLTAISLKRSPQVLANMSATEGKQPQETQQRNIDIQVDGGRNTGEPWEQEVQDRGLSVRDGLNW